MASCVADTSWLLALLNADDEFHHDAVSQAEAMDKIHVPPAVLCETLAAIGFFTKAKREKPRAMRRAVDFLRSKPAVVLCSPDHDHDATTRYWDAHPFLSYHDAAGVAAGKRLGVGLASFDGDQRKAFEGGPGG